MQSSGEYECTWAGDRSPGAVADWAINGFFDGAPADLDALALPGMDLALKDAEAASAREREEAAAVVAAEMAALGKRAEKIAARAAARAQETSRVVAKKRKDAATGNSLKSLLLRLAERM